MSMMTVTLSHLADVDCGFALWFRRHPAEEARCCEGDLWSDTTPTSSDHS
jgi:hypothetical protein